MILTCLARRRGYEPGVVCGERRSGVSEMTTHLVEHHEIEVTRASRVARVFAELAEAQASAAAAGAAASIAVQASAVNRIPRGASVPRRTSENGERVYHCGRCGVAGHNARTCGS